VEDERSLGHYANNAVTLHTSIEEHIVVDDLGLVDAWNTRRRLDRRQQRNLTRQQTCILPRQVRRHDPQLLGSIGNHLVANVDTEAPKCSQESLLEHVHGKHTLFALERQESRQGHGRDKVGQDELGAQHGFHLLNGQPKCDTRGNDGPNRTSVDSVREHERLAFGQCPQSTNVKCSTHTSATECN